MSDYMPKCATCEHFESCIMQKHITEMALILWNISREKSGRKDGFVDGKNVKDALKGSDDESVDSN